MAEEREIHLDAKVCYAAMRARDARFDGRFFVGVSSTGIYCRPVCRVRLPKEENCSFFVSAAAAQAAGYRPCKRCRPELAPGWSLFDSPGRTAGKAALIMEENCLSDTSIASLAKTLGVTDRHLRRAFFERYGVPPSQYLKTVRLLLAKSLLTDTGLTISEVAMSSGFGSIRRFNEVFKKEYKSTPRGFRETNVPENGETITLELGYRPPYAWDELVGFLGLRAVEGVESAEGGVYRRSVAMDSGQKRFFGYISVADLPKKNSLSVTLSCTLLPVLPKVLSRIKCLFDTDCRPQEIYETLGSMNGISPGLCKIGVRVPGSFDPFEISVRAILGQQVTVGAARTLAGRFAEAFGEHVRVPFAGIDRAFPTPEAILRLQGRIEDHLGPLGITAARARSIKALAEAVSSGSVCFSNGADPEREMRKLIALPGIGSWTAQYIGMRAFGWPDCFPSTDHGVKKALWGMTQKEILDISQKWRPWRSYATVNLWNSLKKGD